MWHRAKSGFTVGLKLPTIWKPSWIFCEKILMWKCCVAIFLSTFTHYFSFHSSNTAFDDTIKLSNPTFCLQSSKQFIHSHNRISQVIYVVECVTCLIFGKVWKVNTANSSKKATRLTETTVLYSERKPAVLIISGQTRRELPLHSGWYVCAMAVLKTNWYMV